MDNAETAGIFDGARKAFVTSRVRMLAKSDMQAAAEVAP